MSVAGPTHRYTHSHSASTVCMVRGRVPPTGTARSTLSAAPPDSTPGWFTHRLAAPGPGPGPINYLRLREPTGPPSPGCLYIPGAMTPSAAPPSDPSSDGRRWGPPHRGPAPAQPCAPSPSTVLLHRRVAVAFPCVARVPCRLTAT
jgi:hypothetical protein